MTRPPTAAPKTEVEQKLRHSWQWLRKNGAMVGAELLINFVLPFVIYSRTSRSLGDARALMASSVPPMAWTLWEFIRKRRVDALSILVLVGIGLSLLGFIGGGGVRMLQLRERLATALIGLIFLGSAVIGKPLLYQLARARLNRDSASEAQAFADLHENPEFRRMITVMTGVWGFGLVLESALCCVLVFTLTIKQYLVVNPIIGYAMMGLLVVWTFWYARRPSNDEADNETTASSVQKAKSS